MNLLLIDDPIAYTFDVRNLLRPASDLVSDAIPLEPLPIRRMLRPSFGRILPLLLASIRCQVLDVVTKDNAIHAALRGAVGPVDVAMSVPHEHREHEVFAAAVVGELGPARRILFVIRQNEEKGSSPTTTVNGGGCSQRAFSIHVLFCIPRSAPEACC